MDWEAVEQQLMEALQGDLEGKQISMRDATCCESYVAYPADVYLETTFG